MGLYIECAYKKFTREITRLSVEGQKFTAKRQFMKNWFIYAPNTTRGKDQYIKTKSGWPCPVGMIRYIIVKTLFSSANKLTLRHTAAHIREIWQNKKLLYKLNIQLRSRAHYNFIMEISRLKRVVVALSSSQHHRTARESVIASNVSFISF